MKRDVIQAWSDAAGRNGLGGSYISPNQAQREPGAPFSISILYSITQGKEYINTQQMRAVEQLLLPWSKHWKGIRVHIHSDTKAVVHGVLDRTIWGGSILVLRRCLLLASEYHFDLDPRLLSSKDNTLADTLSPLE